MRNRKSIDRWEKGEKRQAWPTEHVEQLKLGAGSHGTEIHIKLKNIDAEAIICIWLEKDGRGGTNVGACLQHNNGVNIY